MTTRDGPFFNLSLLCTSPSLFRLSPLLNRMSTNYKRSSSAADLRIAVAVPIPEPHPNSMSHFQIGFCESGVWFPFVVILSFGAFASIFVSTYAESLGAAIPLVLVPTFLFAFAIIVIWVRRHQKRLGGWVHRKAGTDGRVSAGTVAIGVGHGAGDDGGYSGGNGWGEGFGGNDNGGDTSGYGGDSGGGDSGGGGGD